jgi:tRNA(Ile)-lysidine synthase
VHARRGGEKIEQPGARRELRTLLQDLGVPPWIRARMPLLLAADQQEVLAAADFAFSPALLELQSRLDTRLRWMPAD